ncbi:MAG: methyl-accepting chemotaxis protein [Lachnospiraceae bacterium]|nr:methyl-accepting chemotaxis protein [Lachnospiraceae bacterium]
MNAKNASYSAGTTSRQNQTKGKATMTLTLILMVLIPLLISSIAIALIAISISKKEVQTNTHNSFVQVITHVGSSFDTIVDKNKELLKGYASAPVVKDLLLNPDDPELKAKAQEYTLNYFGKLEGWEGLYTATWDSTVMTHPAAPVIGMTLREGDSLKGLQNSILSAEDGVYNTGVMTSPASGQIIMSMYTPVMDGDTPIGFAGCGFYVQTIAKDISDISAIKLDTAYVYFVDKQGTMLHHPDEEKVGNPVENEAVKSLVAQIGEGKHPSPDVIVYKYKGATKYAGFYIGENENYIAVLTADEKDVLSAISEIRNYIIIIMVVCVIIFAAVAVVLSRLIALPLIKLAGSLDKLSTGDVVSNCDARSSIKETSSIVASYHALRDALGDSIGSVKNAAANLDTSIVNVDDMTGKNVESITQINTAVNEVAQTSQSVAESAQTMAEKAAELGDNIELLNENVQRLYSASDTIKNANNDATDCMKSVYSGANESVTAMQEITEKISATNSAIEDIRTAIQAIESIAAQTNLLSLNASIEAARAGEAGRGFAVVADEIRSLADSSAASAKEIKQIIENVIVQSNGTVEISNRVFNVINKEQSDIEKAQEKFNVLSDSVEASISEIDIIRQMAGTLDSIKAELTNATSDLGAISEELGASAEEVSASCQTVTDACADTQNQTGEMRNVNEEMRSAISFFTL